MSILNQQINLQQTGPDTYTASSHPDWFVANTLHGGHVAAVLQRVAAAHLVNDPILKAKNDPDVLSLHIEFLRPCATDNSTITVSVLRSGATSSTLQLQLTQHGKLKVLALATSTNFDKDLGPAAKPAWSFNPPPKPIPDFAAIVAHKPDPNWIVVQFSGDILPYASRVVVLYPRGGFPIDGIADSWYGFRGDERMDATYMALMTDNIPSMSDTMLRNGGLYDANTVYGKAEQWDEKNPGVPLEMENTVAQALRATTWNSTVTLDIQFIRRLPEEGFRWVYSRTTAKSMEGGRLFLDVEILNEEGELVCSAQQLIFVLDVQRKFRDYGAGAKI